MVNKMKTYEYTIQPLLLGTMKISKAYYTYLLYPLEETTIPFVMWYVKVGDRDVLIDTGASTEVIMRHSSNRERASYKREATFQEALDSVGASPESIHTVIQTHLHYDHCAHTHLCKNARILVQEAELNFALSPHPVFSGLYESDYLREINFTPVCGDQEVFPGIEVRLAPGHSPGTQSVFISTAGGIVGISGFCCTSDIINPPEKLKDHWPILTPAVHTSSLQAFDSALKTVQSADILIPIHDIAYARRKTIP